MFYWPQIDSLMYYYFTWQQMFSLSRRLIIFTSGSSISPYPFSAHFRVYFKAKLFIVLRDKTIDKIVDKIVDKIEEWRKPRSNFSFMCPLKLHTLIERSQHQVLAPTVCSSTLFTVQYLLPAHFQNLRLQETDMWGASCTKQLHVDFHCIWHLVNYYLNKEPGHDDRHPWVPSSGCLSCWH